MRKIKRLEIFSNGYLNWAKIVHILTIKFIWRTIFKKFVINKWSEHLSKGNIDLINGTHVSDVNLTLNSLQDDNFILQTFTVKKKNQKQFYR